jgi:hypothetical protein
VSTNPAPVPAAPASGNRRPPLPREHGAWFMLLVPLVVGLASPHAPSVLPATLLVVAALTLFLAQDAARRSWRGQELPGLRAWLVLCAVTGGAAGLTFLALRPSVALVAIGIAGGLAFAVELRLERGGSQRQRGASDLLAAAALALAAPAAVLAGHAAAVGPAAELWALCVLFFASGVAHVRLLLACARLRRAPAMELRRAAWPSLALHLTLVAAAAFALLWRPGARTALTALAFAPVVARGLWTAARARGHAPDLKRVGLLESAYALAFTGLVAWSSWQP